MGLYVYGIGASAASELPPLEGVLGEPVYWVHSGPLAAVVSDCALQNVRAERKHIAASQRVLNGLTERLDLLPMAFGTVAQSEHALRRFLDEHRDPLLAQLQRIAGRVEMSLRLSLDAADPIAHLVAATPALQAARDRVFHHGRRPTHDERIRLGQLCDEALRHYREAQSTRVLRIFAPVCAEISQLPLRADSDIAELALLIARDGVGDFETAVNAAATQLPDELVVTIGGPWPPHNFVQLEL